MGQGPPAETGSHWLSVRVIRAGSAVGRAALSRRGLEWSPVVGIIISVLELRW